MTAQEFFDAIVGAIYSYQMEQGKRIPMLIDIIQKSNTVSKSEMEEHFDLLNDIRIHYFALNHYLVDVYGDSFKKEMIKPLKLIADHHELNIPDVAQNYLLL